jgi:hypothetical protein
MRHAAGAAGSGRETSGRDDDPADMRAELGAVEIGARRVHAAASASALLGAAPSAPLDALQALSAHREAARSCWAQCDLLRTGDAIAALADATKDSDLPIDPRKLADDPLLDDAMSASESRRDLVNPQPGAWLSQTGSPST